MASLEFKSSRCARQRHKRPTHVRRDQVCFTTQTQRMTCTESPRPLPRKEIERKLTLNWFSLALRRKRECCLLVLNLVSSTLPCIRQPDKLKDDMSVCAHLCKTKVEVGQDRIPSLHEKVRQSHTTINIVSYLHAPSSKRRPGPPVKDVALDPPSMSPFQTLSLSLTEPSLSPPPHSRSRSLSFSLSLSPARGLKNTCLYEKCLPFDA